jgi:hypothetical protein
MKPPFRLRVPRVVGALALAALFVLLARASWLRWPDVQVDFGRELYVPWRVSRGEQLFRDLRWFNGPLSVWWNALWMRVAGASFLTLALVNLALCALTGVLLHDLLRRASDRTAATVAVALFLLVFAFGQYLPIANYNFIAPYSHELVHGFVLTLVALVSLHTWVRGGSRLHAGLAGLALGAVFLTKAEVFLAGAAATGALFCGGLVCRTTRGRAPAAALFALGLALPPLIAWLVLRRALPTGAEAWTATIGSWAYVGNAQVRALPFYRSIMGTNDPEHMERLVRTTLGSGLYVLVWFLAIARVDPARARGRRAWLVVFAASLGLHVLVLWIANFWNLGRPLPAWMALLAPCIAAGLWRARADTETGPRRALQLALVVLGLVLLAKTLLYARVLNYGFVLSLPAALVLAIGMVSWLPRILEQHRRAGWLMQAVGVSAVLAFAGLHLKHSLHWWSTQKTEIGWGHDRFLAGARGPLVREALAWLDEHMQPDDTLLVLPEGVMLNWLLKKRTPTRWVNFMPPEMLFWGEDEVLTDLEREAPDWVVIMHKNTTEYGFEWFGEDYGQRVMQRVRHDYLPVVTFGAVPLTGGNYGVAVWAPRE